MWHLLRISYRSVLSLVWSNFFVKYLRNSLTSATTLTRSSIVALGTSDSQHIWLVARCVNVLNDFRLRYQITLKLILLTIREVSKKRTLFRQGFWVEFSVRFCLLSESWIICISSNLRFLAIMSLYTAHLSSSLILWRLLGSWIELGIVINYLLSFVPLFNWNDNRVQFEIHLLFARLLLTWLHLANNRRIRWVVESHRCSWWSDSLTIRIQL